MCQKLSVRATLSYWRKRGHFYDMDKLFSIISLKHYGNVRLYTVHAVAKKLIILLPIKSFLFCTNDRMPLTYFTFMTDVSGYPRRYEKIVIWGYSQDVQRGVRWSCGKEVGINAAHCAWIHKKICFFPLFSHFFCVWQFRVKMKYKWKQIRFLFSVKTKMLFWICERSRVWTLYLFQATVN